MLNFGCYKIYYFKGIVEYVIRLFDRVFNIFILFVF